MRVACFCGTDFEADVPTALCPRCGVASSVKPGVAGVRGRQARRIELERALYERLGRSC